MATVAERYALPKFLADVDVKLIREWASTATLDEMKMEHRAMRECSAQWPRYTKLQTWLEAAADLRGFELYPPLVKT